VVSCSELSDQNYVCILYLPRLLHAPHLRRHSLLKEMTSYICSCVEDQGAKYRSIATHTPGNFQIVLVTFLRGILELLHLHFMVGMLLYPSSMLIFVTAFHVL